MPKQKKSTKRSPAASHLTKSKAKTNQAKKRKRLAPELRRMHIMDAATKLIVKQGFLPLPLETLAQDAGMSKALIYTYFPTQYDLFNAVLDRELNGLSIAGFDTATKVNDLDQAVVLCAMLYFEHVVQYGPLLQILISDLYMTAHFDPKVVQKGDQVLKTLARLARKTLSLSNKEISASIEMLAAIPEEAGSLAFHKDLDAKVAREVCHTLILSSLKALRSPAATISSASDGA